MSSSGLTRVDNRAQMSWSPTSWLITAALLVLLGTAGFVLRPALDYKSALDEETVAEEELGSLARMQAKLDRLEQEAGLDDLERAASVLHGLIPERPGKVDLYGDLRSAANFAGVELSTLAFEQSDLALGPGGSGEWVHLVGAKLSGEARPDAIARMVQLLRTSGRPVLVNRFSLQRSEYSLPVFQFSLSLGFPFYGPAPKLEGTDPMASLPR